MNKLHKAAMAAFALSASGLVQAAAPQQGGLDGFVAIDLGYGNSSSTGGWGEEGRLTDVQGTVGYTAANGLGGQLDVRGFEQQWSNGFSAGILDFAGHAYYRNDQWLLGLFGQKRQYYFDGDRLNTKEYYLGVEGQWFLQDNTLYGRVGQATYTTAGGVEYEDSPFASVELRHFIHDNLRLDASFSYLSSNYGSYEWDEKTYNMGAEYRFADSPFSVYGGLEYSAEDENSGWGADHRRVLLGIKYNFGKGSLRQSDRDGASLKPFARDLQSGGPV